MANSSLKVCLKLRGIFQKKLKAHEFIFNKKVRGFTD